MIVFILKWLKKGVFRTVRTFHQVVFPIKNSEKEKSRHSSGVARSLLAAGVSFRAAAKDSPSRFEGVAGPSVVPVSSRTVCAHTFHTHGRHHTEDTNKNMTFVVSGGKRSHS